VSADFGFRRPVFAAGTAGIVALTATSTEEPPRTTVHFSSDGTAWEATASLEEVRLRAVIAGGPGFVAVGSGDASSGGTMPVVASSTDGRGWDVHELGAEHGGALSDVAVTATGLVAVGHTADETGAPHPAAWTSSDGARWAAGGPRQFGDARAVLGDVATAGSVVVTVGQVPTESDAPGPMLAWWSSDGRRWEASPTPGHGGSVLVGDLTSGSAGAVLVGTPFDARTPYAWLSPDGRGWDSAPMPTLPDTDSSFAFDVAWGGDRYVVAGDDVNFAEGLGPATGRPAIWTSDDAIAWDRVPPAELEGPALQAGSDAMAVLHRDGTWLVYGTTSAAVDAPTSWVLWVGLATS
jgi:hypothetical protein